MIYNINIGNDSKGVKAMLFPDKWGRGALVSFSGANGICDRKKAMYGRLLGDRFGIDFLNRAVFSIDMTDIDHINPCCVLSDVITADIYSGQDQYKCCMLMTSQNVMLFYSSMYVNANLTLDGEYEHTHTDEYDLYESDSLCFVMAFQKQMGTKYALSCADNKKEAVDSALKALKLNVNAETNKKIDYYQVLPQPINVIDDIQKLYYKCISTVKASVADNEFSPERQGVLLPCADRLNSINVFKSIISAVAVKNIFPVYAKSTLLTIWDMILKSGALPFDEQCREEIIAPPLLAWAFLEIFSDDAKTLDEVYNRLRDSVKYVIDKRDINNNNVFEWKCDSFYTNFNTECNMVNSPRFDDGVLMDSVDLSSFVANEARSLGAIAKIIGKRSEAAYWDVMYSRVKNAINIALFDVVDGFYYDKTLVSSIYKRVKTVAGFIPLFAGVCTNEIASVLLDKLSSPAEFNTRVSIPTVTKRDIKSQDMYRGPMWLEYNYLIARGLKEYGYNEKAEEIIKKSVLTVKNEFERHGVIYECYSTDASILTENMSRYGINSQFSGGGAIGSPVRDYLPSAAICAEYILNLHKL